MFKLLGALLIITSCTFFGYQSLIKSRESLSAIRQLKAVLQELSRNISFHLESLPEAISRLKESLSYGEDSFLALAEQSLKEDPTTPISLHWKEAAKSFCTRVSLPERVFSELDKLGDSLGKTDYQAECERLDRVSEDFGAILKEMESTTQKKEQTVKSLSILLGVFVVILLL